ncbi:arylesterase [Stappia taiwanensis]|uniref:arylesterase n=1 Tax=Stappia taiwanensis TaxID=992267 RepID=UPI0019C7E2F3|nr:arylesterase [Stappia taiwanensis]GGF00737.1 arylesterase [Stappia taiwanensis]
MIRKDTFFALCALAAFGLGGGAVRAETLAKETPAAEVLTIVALGDSLTAGYQLPPEEAFPAQLEAALRARGHQVAVVNAGVSGDTTSGGLARLDWSVGADSDAVIVALGGNDALRGLPPATTRSNLEQIVGALRARGLPVLLAGIKAPRNLGDEYADAFDAVFPAVAEAQGALLYPFFLDGVPISPETVQADGIHPTGAGVGLMVKGILPSVEELISRARASGG